MGKRKAKSAAVGQPGSPLTSTEGNGPNDAGGQNREKRAGNINGTASLIPYVSGAQVNLVRMYGTGIGDKIGKVSKPGSMHPKRFAGMMRDPTIRLAVQIVIAMMQRQPWAVEGEDPNINDANMARLAPHRNKIIKSAVIGCLRDGWRAFEVSFDLVDGVKPYNPEREHDRADDDSDPFNADFLLDEEPPNDESDDEPDVTSQENSIAGVKPLKPERTDPLMHAQTGDFVGVENTDVDGNRALIAATHCIFCNFDDAGEGDLGEPLFKVAEGPYLKWEAADVGAQRYDQKIAGGFMWAQYPVGNTPYSDTLDPAGANANDEDNAIIAKALLAAVESAGSGATPVKVDTETGEVVETGWKLEHVSAKASGAPEFVTRQKYLDALKLRAFGIPERSATEGTFGTKAEAEAHADIAILVNLDRHGVIVDAINKGPLRAMNEANYGNPDKCTLVLGKLEPQDRQLFTEIFKALMNDPVLGDTVAQQVDVQVLLEKLNVPTLSEDAKSMLEDAMLENKERQAKLDEQQAAKSFGQR